MMDPAPPATNEGIFHSAPVSEQSRLALCGECRKLNFEYLQAHPEEGRLLYIRKESECACCKFLRTAVLMPGSVPHEDFYKETVCDVEVRSYEETAKGKSSIGTLVAAIHSKQDIERLSVLLQLKVSKVDSQNPSYFSSIEPELIDYSLIRSWINNCQQCHASTCSRQHLDDDIQNEGILGFKVIDCVERYVKEKDYSSTQYVALSYVWGDPQQMPARGSGKSEAFSSTLPPALPSTIEDAVSVTKELGFRYLWVDKYCINQGDAAEVRYQIRMMDMIYHAASVTIIAAAGPDANYKLPGVGLRSRTTKKTIEVNGST